MQRNRISKITAAVKLGSTPYRYLNTKDGHVALWTTRRLYANGDYAAYWISPENMVLIKVQCNVKDDCRSQAYKWLGVHIDNFVTYRISEEP